MNSDAGSREAEIHRAAAPLVGRVEGSQGVDLVTEPLDPDGHGLPGREDVDDAAAPRELAAAADLGYVLIAKIDERADHTVRAKAQTGAQRERMGRDVGGRKRALEERLHAGDKDARSGGVCAPCRQRRDTGGRFIAHQLGALIGKGRPRLQSDHLLTAAQPGRQLLSHAVGDLGISGDPDQPVAGGLTECRCQVGLGTVGDAGIGDVPQVTPDPTAGCGPIALDECLQLARARQQGGER